MTTLKELRNEVYKENFDNYPVNEMYSDLEILYDLHFMVHERIINKELRDKLLKVIKQEQLKIENYKVR